MRKIVLALCLVALCHQSINAEDLSATQLVTDIYKSCLSQYSVSCVKPKALSWISHAVNSDKIKITDELSIIRTGEDEFTTEPRSSNAVINFYDRIDSFLTSHSLKMEVPEILKTDEVREQVPRSLLEGGLAEGIQIPLVEGKAVEGRGFVKKVMIPFLLGLKLNTTVLVPLALGLIALKTWKALTLGLLSLVMTAAMVIFKFAKPKIVNYEVVHYPHSHVIDHHHPHSHAHIHHQPPPHLDIVQPHVHGWARNGDAQETAYNAYL